MTSRGPFQPKTFYDSMILCVPSREGIACFLLCSYSSSNTYHELREMEEGSQGSGCGAVYVHALSFRQPN